MFSVCKVTNKRAENKQYLLLFFSQARGLFPLSSLSRITRITRITRTIRTIRITRIPRSTRIIRITRTIRITRSIRIIPITPITLGAGLLLEGPDVGRQEEGLPVERDGLLGHGTPESIGLEGAMDFCQPGEGSTALPQDSTASTTASTRPKASSARVS